MSAWVLLRGLTREQRHWGSFPALLSRAIVGAQVLTVDLPGNGNLCTKRSPATVEGLAQAVRDDLLRRDLAPPFFVVGMSLGAMVTVAWAARHPAELRGCVLINTSMRPFCPFYRRLRPANYATLLELMVATDPERCERLILQMTSRDVARTESVLTDWIRFRAEHHVSRPNAMRQLLAAARFRAPSAKPIDAVLVLTSACDALVDVRCSRRLAQAWRTDFAEHPSAGHDLPLDDAPWVVQQVACWVEARI